MGRGLGGCIYGQRANKTTGISARTTGRPASSRQLHWLKLWLVPIGQLVSFAEAVGPTSLGVKRPPLEISVLGTAVMVQLTSIGNLMRCFTFVVPLQNMQGSNRMRNPSQCFQVPTKAEALFSRPRLVDWVHRGFIFERPSSGYFCGCLFKDTFLFDHHFNMCLFKPP